MILQFWKGMIVKPQGGQGLQRQTDGRGGVEMAGLDEVVRVWQIVSGDAPDPVIKSWGSRRLHSESKSRVLGQD